MNLPDYIKAIGHEAAAKAFGVSESTIKSWRWGARSPRPDRAREIQRITRGRVSVAEIYSDKND